MVVPMLVWMDLEMTGLDQTTDVIVEIATLVTDDELNIVAEGPDLVVHQPDEALANMDKVVVDMHTHSGLLELIKASTVTLEEAGAATLAFIQTHVPDAHSAPLCGNSIGMDRRLVDVSTIKELARRWYPEALANVPKKATNHRALDDIRESLVELQFWRSSVFRSPSS